ncbi:pre-mRNA-splicing factor ATP-dependent RNA helicase DEAH1-like isoform X2 [Dendrobium catenatum]|uniref:pre-mRNA-splicing factor ATP-dependent RNA helicase DEAH1-like isoform X2 n=1 Tax=Dendrobium catenatum TaxID=906689 RepID=UPI00109F2422|nr:pre-mRNA-splicing factor ATP-dependent RNA helicase DEAH1-like isoform X2 [Dendrobium catenatum]
MNIFVHTIFVCRYKKKIYELAKEHMDDSDKIEEYRMPEAYDKEGGVNQEKRFAVAMQRYRDSRSSDKMNPFAELEAWEEHQIGKASLRYGSKNKKLSSDDYQYVFEDGIDFIKASVLDGTQHEDEMAEEPNDSAAKTMLEKLQEERKSLPIYPYREELLKAINDHQDFFIMLQGSKRLLRTELLRIHKQFTYIQAPAWHKQATFLAFL